MVDNERSLGQVGDQSTTASGDDDPRVVSPEIIDEDFALAEAMAHKLHPSPEEWARKEALLLQMGDVTDQLREIGILDRLVTKVETGDQHQHFADPSSYMGREDPILANKGTSNEIDPASVKVAIIPMNHVDRDVNHPDYGYNTYHTYVWATNERGERVFAHLGSAHPVGALLAYSGLYRSDEKRAALDGLLRRLPVAKVEGGIGPLKAWRPRPPS